MEAEGSAGFWINFGGRTELYVNVNVPKAQFIKEKN